MEIEDHDRDRRLSSFNESYKNKFEDSMKLQKTEIIQAYSKLFDHELTKAETYAKGGDYVKAALHAFIAREVNNYTKTLI
jgi:hypothetical protein